MPRQRINEKTVAKAWKVEGDRLEIWDDLLKGFGLRVTANGAKTFFAFGRVDGRKVRVTLGPYPRLNVVEAREQAREALRSMGMGVDPRARPEKGARTVADLVDEFEKRHIPKLKGGGGDKLEASAYQTMLHLRMRFLPRFRGRAPDTIKRAEIRALLDDIVDQGANVTANRTFAAIRKLFNWAMERGELDASPCIGIAAPAKEVQRSRFLTKEEIKTVWQAADVLTPINAAFVRVLLLTGQRRASVAQMARSQIADGVWTVPREKMKGDREQTVPLSPAVLKIIDDLPCLGDLVFTHDGRRAVAGFSKLKAQMDAEIDRLTGREEDGPPTFTPWRLHDLRRTAGTHIARLGFPRLLVSKILGHAEGGVTQIYELHSYDDEKRRALDAWGAQVEEIVAGKEAASNVIPLRG